MKSTPKNKEVNEWWRSLSFEEQGLLWGTRLSKFENEDQYIALLFEDCREQEKNAKECDIERFPDVGETIQCPPIESEECPEPDYHSTEIRRYGKCPFCSAKIENNKGIAVEELYNEFMDKNTDELDGISIFQAGFNANQSVFNQRIKELEEAVELLTLIKDQYYEVNRNVKDKVDNFLYFINK